MALRSKLRHLTTSSGRRHQFSTLTLESTTPFTSHGKARYALSLLRAQPDPQRILDICRSASLSPASRLDRLAFSKAIYNLKESNHFHHIRTLLQESIAQHQDECNISHFIELYGQAGLLEDAIKTFQDLEKFGVERSVISLNSLLAACFVAKEYGELRRIFTEFPVKYEITRDLETYNTLIRGFCKSGQAGLCYSVVAEMERKGVEPSAKTFALMIEGFYQEEKLEDVGKVFEMMRMRRVPRVILTFNARIRGLCYLGRMKEARALLYGILSDGRDLRPNWATYSHLVRGYCMQGNLKEAVLMFEEMKSRSLLPRSECYFVLVQHLCEGKDFKAALNYTKECMENNWDPEPPLMKSLVDGLVSIRKMDEARQLIGHLKERYSTNGYEWSEIEERLPG